MAVVKCAELRPWFTGSKNEEKPSGTVDRTCSHASLPLRRACGSPHHNLIAPAVLLDGEPKRGRGMRLLRVTVLGGIVTAGGRYNLARRRAQKGPGA